MREQLIYLLEDMDDNLLQSVYDYTNGLLAGLRDDEVNDWWNDLTPQQQQQIEMGLTDNEQVDLLSENGVNQAVKALFDKHKKLFFKPSHNSGAHFLQSALQSGLLCESHNNLQPVCSNLRLGGLSTSHLHSRHIRRRQR